MNCQQIFLQHIGHLKSRCFNLTTMPASEGGEGFEDQSGASDATAQQSTQPPEKPKRTSGWGGIKNAMVEHEPGEA